MNNRWRNCQCKADKQNTKLSWRDLCERDSPHCSFLHLSLILSLPHKLPMLPSIPQLTRSAPANDISSAPPDPTSAAANKIKEQHQRHYTPHAAQIPSTRPTSSSLCSMRMNQLGAIADW